MLKNIIVTFETASSTISLNARFNFDFAYSACCGVRLRNSAAIYSARAPNLSFGCKLIERSASTAISFNCIDSLDLESTDGDGETFEALDVGRETALRLFARWTNGDNGISILYSSKTELSSIVST